jgi:hypothetical protein
VREESSFSEEKEAKRLLTMAYGLALPADVASTRRAALTKVFFASFFFRKKKTLQ